MSVSSHLSVQGLPVRLPCTPSVFHHKISHAAENLGQIAPFFSYMGNNPFFKYIVPGQNTQ